jgi:hypothetical protein
MGQNQAVPTPTGSATVQPAIDAELRRRLDALCTEGWAIWERFAADVGDRYFHPFVAAEYELVCEALLVHRGPGLRFLEWGSATGVITVMADLLGFEAHGIELDGSLVTVARELAGRHDSKARFAAGSFLPAGYRWRPSDGDGRIGTLGTGPSGYLELGRSLDEFDLVFGYPWDGEEPMMLDVMRSYGRPDAVLLLNSVTAGVLAYRGGRRIYPGVTAAGVGPAAGTVAAR